MPIRIHLDTDLGGDIDDVAALAMLLNWPNAEITGITTVADDGGRRAGYVNYTLRMANRSDIAVAAGVDVSTGQFRYPPGYPNERDFWPETVARMPGDLELAMSLLKQSIDLGAIVVGTGPCSNLAVYERRYPGYLRRTAIFLVGGYVFRPRPDRSIWGNEMDYNFQIDVASALLVLKCCNPTLVPLHVTTETALRRSDLARLDQGGPIAALLARQARAFDTNNELEEIDRANRNGLPEDFINHLYDPLACAIALGWPGAVVETLPLVATVEDGVIHQSVAEGGVPTRVVTCVDGPGFDRMWLDLIAPAN